MTSDFLIYSHRVRLLFFVDSQTSNSNIVTLTFCRIHLGRIVSCVKKLSTSTRELVQIINPHRVRFFSSLSYTDDYGTIVFDFHVTTPHLPPPYPQLPAESLRNAESVQIAVVQFYCRKRAAHYRDHTRYTRGIFTVTLVAPFVYIYVYIQVQYNPQV